MVTLLLDQTQLAVELSPIERTLALRRKPVRIDRSAIRRVQLTDDPWTWLRGIRAPGTHVPGTLALGTWRTSKGVDFVVVRGRRRPGVVIELDGHEFERVILTTRHGVALVQSLRLDDVSSAADVADLASGAQERGGSAPSGS